jgi:hypothetical protein
VAGLSSSKFRHIRAGAAEWMEGTLLFVVPPSGGLFQALSIIACAGGWKRPDFDDSGWSAVRRLDNRHSARGWHGWRLVPSSPIDPRYVADSVHDVFPLLSAGLGERYLETLAPWRDMLTMGLTTFAERPEPTRSDCHAWSSGANSCGVARARCCSPARRRLPSSAAPAGRERSLY